MAERRMRLPVAKHTGQHVEARLMLAETLDRVVLRLPGRHQEGPITRLQQQQLAAQLRERPRQQRLGRPRETRNQLLQRAFALMNDRPHPADLLVVPDPVMAARSPGTLRHANARLGGNGLKRLGNRGQGDVRAIREGADELLQPLHAFEPPMPEELGIEGNGDEPLTVMMKLVLAKHVREHPGIVAGMVAGPQQRRPRVVDGLIGEVHALATQAPILKPRLLVLLVKLPVERVPRIAVFRRPDLVTRPLVASHDRHGGTVQQVGSKGRETGFRDVRSRGRREAGVGAEARPPARNLASLNRMGIHHEVTKPFLIQKRLEPWAVTRCGPVGALGKPDAARFASEMLAVGRCPHVELRVKAGIPPQQGREAVGGR
ncbi:hypothetical protein D3C87_1097990 [compost metagenome]